MFDAAIKYPAPDVASAPVAVHCADTLRDVSKNITIIPIFTFLTFMSYLNLQGLCVLKPVGSH